MQETRNYGLAFVNFSCGSAVLHETVSRSTPRKVNVQVGGMSLRWLIVKPKSCSNCSNYDFIFQESLQHQMEGGCRKNNCQNLSAKTATCSL